MPEKPEKKAAIEKALRGFKFINPIRDKVGKGKPARTEKPGVPHGVDKKTQKGEQILEVAKGGSVTGRGIGPAGASIVSDDGKRIKTLKKIEASLLPLDAASVGMVSGIGKLTKKLAGRLAKRGYGKARK